MKHFELLPIASYVKLQTSPIAITIDNVSGEDGLSEQTLVSQTQEKNMAKRILLSEKSLLSVKKMKAHTCIRKN